MQSAGGASVDPPPLPEATLGRGAERDDRRNFLAEALAAAIGAVLGLVPLAAGLMVFLDPLRRRSGAARFVRVAPLDSLSQEGIPRQFPVVADRDDAWNRYPAQPLGSVFLRREGDRVHALNADCPHLGCMVDFLPEEKSFRCPCHDSRFKLDGDRIIPPDGNCPAPRSLDPLVAEVRGKGSGAMVWVKFEKFRAGTPKRIPEA